MITDRIGRQEVLLSIYDNFNTSHLSARVMARTVQLLRHDAYCPLLNCPIKAEIRAVDSQSDLRILL